MLLLFIVCMWRFCSRNLSHLICFRNLVEAKRTTAWSEVINGGPLGANPYLKYFPHDSFDVNGYLRQEAFEATDQGWVTNKTLSTYIQSFLALPC